MRGSKYKAFSRGVMLARQEFVIYHTNKWVLLPFPPCPFNPYLSPHWSSALILARCPVRVPLRYPRPVAGSLGALLTHSRFTPPHTHTPFILSLPHCVSVSPILPGYCLSHTPTSACQSPLHSQARSTGSWELQKESHVLDVISP